MRTSSALVFCLALAFIGLRTVAFAQAPSDHAVILLRSTVVTIAADYSSVTKVHCRIKINDSAGQSLADVSIPIDSSAQSVSGITATTTLPNGQVLTLSPSLIVRRHIHSGYAMYDDAQVVAFTMPGAQPGAVIDYSYAVTALKPVIPSSFCARYVFGHTPYPITQERYAVTTPASIRLAQKLHNASATDANFSQTTSGALSTLKWIFRNIPAAEQEAWAAPDTMSFPWVEVSTIRSWSDVSKWYAKIAVPEIVVTPQIQSITSQVTSGKTTDIDKAKAIYYWVIANIRYVGVELGQSAYKPHAAAQVLSNRYGDCKDTASLLVAMLHAAGIADAHLALVSPEYGEEVDTFLPDAEWFTHCIVRVDIEGQSYWLDGTSPDYAFTDPPASDRGTRCLVIGATSGPLFDGPPIYAPGEDGLSLKKQITLDADGSADVDLTFTSKGEVATALRGIIRQSPPNQLTDVLRNLIDLPHFSGSPAANIANTSNPDLPLTIEFKGHDPQFMNRVGHIYIFKASAAGLSLASQQINADTRIHPIYSRNRLTASSVTDVAENGSFDFIDKSDDFQFTNPYGSVNQRITVDSDSVHCYYDVTVNSFLAPGTQAAQMNVLLQAIGQANSSLVVMRKM